MSVLLSSLKIFGYLAFMVLFLLVWIIFTLIRYLSWKIQGISIPPPGLTARVLKIQYRFKLSSVFPAHVRDFFATHESFADPNVILRLPNVSLYSINPKNAIFVQCAKTDDELTKAHSFYYQAQFLNATKVIILPISEYHRVAKLIGEPKSLHKADTTEHNEDEQIPPVGDIIFLYSIGRCGSTLLTQMLEVLPRTLSLSEPDSFTHLVGYKGSPAEKRKMLYSSLIFEAKRLLRKDVDRIVIKFRSQCTPQAQIIHELFPDIRLLFMYRNPQPNILSFKRVFGDMDLVKVYFGSAAFKWILSGGINRMLEELRPKDIPIYTKPEVLKKITTNMASFSAYSYVGNSSKYMELYEANVEIKAVKYESLLLKPKEIFVKLCEHIHVKLTTELIEKAVKTMEKDSQAGTAISRSKKKGTGLTVEEIDLIKYVMSHHPLLNVDEPELPGTM